MKRWRVSLKTEIRNLHSQSEWRRLLEDFDKQQLSSCVCIIYCTVHIVAQTQTVADARQYMLGHGCSQFIRADKAAKMIREAEGQLMPRLLSMFCCMSVEHVLLRCCLILTVMARCGFSQDWFSAFSGPSRIRCWGMSRRW